MEIDAFEARNARVGVLRQLGVLLYTSTSPPGGMKDMDFDVMLCAGGGMNVSCKVPRPAAEASRRGSKKKPEDYIKDFVKEFCYLVSIR